MFFRDFFRFMLMYEKKAIDAGTYGFDAVKVAQKIIEEEF